MIKHSTNGHVLYNKIMPQTTQSDPEKSQNLSVASSVSEIFSCSPCPRNAAAPAHNMCLEALFFM